jgi:hypothetical protein
MKHFIRTFFADKNNKIILWQFPNLPLIGWLVFVGIGYFVAPGSIKTGFAQASGGFLFIWSYLEITQGATNFRRLLGVVVGILVFVGYFR